MGGDSFDIGVSHRRLLALATLSIALVAAFGFGLLYYASTSIDRIERQRETLLVQRAVDRNLVRLSNEVMSATVWQEAYDRTLKVDPEWMHQNFGDYFYKSFGHDLTAVFAPSGEPVYASRKGRMSAKDAESAFETAVRPLADKARASELARRFDAQGKRRMNFEDAVTVTGAVQVGKGLFLAAASPIVPERTDRAPGQPATVVVTARSMGPAYLEGLRADLGVDAPRVAGSVQDTAHGPSSIVLKNWRGQGVGVLAWRAHRPGVSVLRSVSAPVAAILGALVVLVILIMARVGAILTRLRTNDEALARSLDELTIARSRAEAANEAKSQFLANMSHEIRTPLNGVLGMAQVMAADPLDPKQQERVQIIRSSGERLLLILNDILDLSKIEAGRIELVAGDFEMEVLLRESCAMFTLRAEEKGLYLEASCAPEACGYWFGDRLRVGQIIANLVSNALKFTPTGGVRVKVEEVAGQLSITVTDTGVGISDAARENLFSKFNQVDNSDTRQFGGAGLGLAIIRELTYRMGGEIEVESAEGEGSCFKVRLPLSRSRADSPRQAATSEPCVAIEAEQTLRVLAVEDNAVNRMLLEALLEPLELSLEMVEDGAAGVRAFQPGKYDLILMDVQMPVMDGVAATRRIREIEAELGARRTPVIMLTANVMSHQLQGYADAGADGCVAKPIQLHDLLQAIESALDQADLEEAPAAKVA